MGYERGMGLRGVFVPSNVKVTGAARLYRAACTDRRERGRPQGYAALFGS